MSISTRKYLIVPAADRAAERQEKIHLRALKSSMNTIAGAAEQLALAVESGNLSVVKASLAIVIRQQGQITIGVRRLARVVGGPDA